MCACVCHSLPIPGLSPVASCQGRLLRRGRAGRDRASALKAVPSRYLSTLGLLSSGVVGVVASHPLSMREGPGSIPGLSMPMCACVCHSLPIPGLSPFGFAVRLAKGGCFRRGRAPNVTLESYIESRKLSVPRAQAARTDSRPARLETACSAAAGCLTSRSSHKSFASRAFPGRTRLSTASTNQRSAPAAERKRKEEKPLGLRSSGVVGVVVSHPLSMREGPGSIPGLSMPMCACVCHSLLIPGLFLPLGLLCVLPRAAAAPRTGAERHF